MFSQVVLIRLKLQFKQPNLTVLHWYLDLVLAFSATNVTTQLLNALCYYRPTNYTRSYPVIVERKCDIEK